MKTLAQLRSEPSSERVRHIWCGIVQFANADLAVDKHAFENFIELLARCSHKETEADWERSEAGKRAFERELKEELSAEKMSSFEDAAYKLNMLTANMVRKGVIEDGINQEHLELLVSFDELDRCTWKEDLTHWQALKLLAVKHHKDFRRMVTWLCAPDKHPELASKAVLFLQKNLRRTQVNLFDTTATLSNASGSSHPIFYLRSDDYDSIMSPICEFVFSRIERYHDGELKLREAVPIRICERPGCGKFHLPERIGRKRYCSDVCRARAFQMRVDWAAYMRKHRQDLKDMARPTRRKR